MQQLNIRELERKYP
jgi:putative ABC transport system ATP-binding protein